MTCRLSLGIFAWNEAGSIAGTLDSLFQQSFLEELARVGWSCEIVCVANGCTDRTAEIAEEAFARQKEQHRWADCFDPRVARIDRPGKINAWNQFVHSISAPGAQYLVMMDADIHIHRRETLWNMISALEQNADASVAVDRPRKDIHFKRRKSFQDGVSLAASRMTSASEAQLCGQLYCIRSVVARSIYLPRELAACEDGMLKALVCTDNLAHEVWANRICVAEEAEHTFEAYTSPAAILRNQKRQIIGQTMVHILVDKEFPQLMDDEGGNLASTIRARESSDPDWLKRLVGEHLRATRFFWRLYPSLLTQGPGQWRALDLRTRVRTAPAVMIRWVVMVFSSWLAYRTLKSGCMSYWPKARRKGVQAASRAPLGRALADTGPIGSE